jgi:PUA domain protein
LSKRLRKSDIRELNETLPIELDKKDDVQIEENILLVNNEFYFFKHENRWIPSVRLLLEQPDILPHLVVDIGAVRFVANGADIMRPGIIDIPDGNEGHIVAIVDENNRKPFAVGKYNLDSETMRSQENGSVVANVHYVGDELWNKYVTTQ